MRFGFCRRGVTVEWLPVSDGEAIPADVIARALSVIDRVVSSGRSVLVACRAGRSLSASLAIGYLRLQGYDWDTACRLVEQKLRIRELSEAVESSWMSWAEGGPMAYSKFSIALLSPKKLMAFIFNVLRAIH